MKITFYAFIVRLDRYSKGASACGMLCSEDQTACSGSIELPLTIEQGNHFEGVNGVKYKRVKITMEDPD